MFYDAERFQKELDDEFEAEAAEWIKNGMKKTKTRTSGDVKKERSCIRTYTGKLFYPFQPNPKDVDVRDIAHHLSHICRFAGAGQIFWSVAQHAMLAADLAMALSHGETRLAQLIKANETLHHDDSEAYCIDLPKPIKNFIPAYEEMEKGVTDAIKSALGLDGLFKDFVKVCDNLAYEAEAIVLFNKTALKSELERDCSFARLARLSFTETEKMFLDYADLLASELQEEREKAKKFDFTTHEIEIIKDAMETQW